MPLPFLRLLTSYVEFQYLGTLTRRGRSNPAAYRGCRGGKTKCRRREFASGEELRTRFRTYQLSYSSRLLVLVCQGARV